MMGLKMPVGVNPSGGAALMEGDINDAKIIKMALSSDDNENAFQQDIGLGVDMIFGISDTVLQSQITRRVIRLFQNFQTQKRFKLLRNTLKWTEDASQQELTLEFRYVNLESDEEVFFRRAFTAAEG